MIAQILVVALLAGAVSAGIVASGTSISSRKQDDFGNYAFNYDIVDGLGAQNGRWEAGDAWGNKRGAYTITDIDGRARLVEYVADAAGFRAVVKTNEPGTAASAPAAAVVASPYAGPAVYGPGPVVAKAAVVAPVVAAAPIYAAPAYAAPVVAKAPVYAAHSYVAPVVAKGPIYAAVPKAPVYASHGYGYGYAAPYGAASFKAPVYAAPVGYKSHGPYGYY